ncbi:MAG: co-chaperone YbbN, partial [Mesorhizobium sp.]
MSDNNPFGGPFGGNGGQYTTSVQYGGTAPAPAKVALGDAPAAPAAPADVIKDTTTA